MQRIFKLKMAMFQSKANIDEKVLFCKIIHLQQPKNKSNAGIALEYTHRYGYLMQAGSMINITIFFSFQTHHMNSTRRLED